jgi:hypothetical protein
VLTTLGVVVALAVVAVASRGSTPVGEAGGRRPSDTLLDILFTLYLVLLVAGAVFFVYLLALQRKLRREGGMGPVSRFSPFVLAVLLLVGLVSARRLQGFERRPPLEQEVPVPGVGVPVPAETGETAAQQQPSYEADFAWIPVLVFVGLLAAGLGSVWWAGVRRRRARSTREPATLGEALADVLDETLDALRAERDPRRAVIGAYARLERVLAANGLARRPAEAPLEYLGRVLEDLSVSRSAVRRLTLLFQRAKFSQHEVGEEMKDEAIQALQTVQDELRAAEALALLERERAARSPVEQARKAG